ncbi:MAG: type IV pilus modification protein PilV [Gammaproteobacteria bacterium]
MMTNFSRYPYQKGVSMMEILVTLIIVLIGLLGIAALQAKAQLAELESHQRAQALILLSDIVDRININRKTLSCFQITTTGASTQFIGAAGAGHMGTPACAASTTAYNTQADNAITELDNLLQGTAEKLVGADVENVGAMTGARACISYDASTELGGVSGTGLYTIVVSWQGMGALVAPTVNCANGLYGGSTLRRAVSTTMRIANLY